MEETRDEELKDSKDQNLGNVYLQRAEAHKQALVGQLKTFLKTGVFVIAAVVILVFLTFSWFASNDSVTAKNMKISAAEDSFELSSEGVENNEAPLLSQVFDNWGGWKYIAGSIATTSGEKNSINWLLSDKKDLSSLQPGKSGVLTFYVIPNFDGDLEVTFNLNMIAYKETQAEEYAFKDEDDVRYTEMVGENENLINGHILFFTNQKNIHTDSQPEEYTYKEPYNTWIKDGNFRLTKENVHKGDKIEVKLYWVWPSILGQCLLPDGAINLGTKASLFSADTRKLLLDDMSVEENIGKYFYDLDEEFVFDDFKESLASLYDGDYLALDYTTASAYYNRADQYIGSEIRYVVIKINAN